MSSQIIIDTFRAISGKILSLLQVKNRFKNRVGEKRYCYIRNSLLHKIDKIHRNLYYGTKTLGIVILNWLSSPLRHKKILGIVQYEPVTLAIKKGFLKSQLEDYYNPCGYFEEVHIFAYQDKDFDISPNIHVHGFLDNKSSDELTYLCRKHRVKILRNYHVYWTHLLSLEVKKRLKIPAIISLHDNRFIYDTIAGYDHIFAYVEWLVEEMKKRFERNNISLLLNRIDHNLFKPLEDAGIPEELYNFNNRIVSSARLYEAHKNFSTVIRAMRKVVDKYPSTLLYIAGDGPDRNLYEKMIKKLGLENNIRLSRLHKQTELVKYLNWADFFVLVNTFGSSDKAITEALMVGKPVVATDRKGESILHLRNGFNARVVNWEKHKDPNTVAKAIMYMIEHKRDFDSTQIREHAIRVYNYDYWMNQEASVYKRLMCERYGYR